MSRFRREGSWEKFLYSWPAVVVLAAVVVWLSQAVWSAYGRYNLVVKERRELSNQLEALANHKSELAAEVKSLETERGLEGRLRANLPVARVGEGVIVVVEATTTPAAPPPIAPWWRRWLGLPD